MCAPSYWESSDQQIAHKLSLKTTSLHDPMPIDF